MGYRILADVTMLAHFTFLVYVTLGGFLAWRWPKAIWPHALMAGWGFSTVLFGFHCPLTYVEDWARQRAGQQGLPSTGFIDHYIEGVIYPERYAGLVQFAVAAVVLISWIGALVLYLRRRKRRREAVA